jgi:hypothetical protein
MPGSSCDHDGGLIFNVRTFEVYPTDPRSAQAGSRPSERDFDRRDKGVCAAVIEHETRRVSLVVPKIAATKNVSMVNEMRCGSNPSLAKIKHFRSTSQTRAFSHMKTI